MRAQDVIDRLGLAPLPWEGGYFRETWRGDIEVPASTLPKVYGASRHVGTAIYYLLTPDTVSRLHRLPSDEVFHFYLGDTVEVVTLTDARAYVTELGPNIMSGQVVQLVVPGNTWFGARLAPDGNVGFALMGTTVAPGFDFDDLEMGAAEPLMSAFPDAAEMIRALT